MALLTTATSDVATRAPKMLEQAAKGPEKRLNVKMDAGKHERFRLACMTNHTTMTKAIEKFIDDYLAKAKM